ncbi:uncharacterized protein PG998_012002 [Apiospora kogelbergensis]|uniref:uncharacterized protein n=1 Tax=Apiospora kogelbergensis TaxID=1337665 RepID=UPI0031309ED9
MESKKNTLSMTIHELEKEFKSLSLQVKENQKKVKETRKKVHKATMGFVKQPPMEVPKVPKLPRDSNKEELIREIDELIKLCDETQKVLKKEKQRESDVFGGSMEAMAMGAASGSEVGSLLDAILECFD